MDKVDSKTRSKIMSRVYGKGTKPEIFVRKILFSHRYRYRLNVSTLPGSPDIVLKKNNVLVFINGCFWHGHNCETYKMPTSNTLYWEKKIKGNRERDIRNIESLLSLGWRVCVIWGCFLKKYTNINNEQDFFETIKCWLTSDNKFTEF